MPALSYKSNFVDFVEEGLKLISYIDQNGCCPTCGHIITNKEYICWHCEDWTRDWPKIRIKRQTIRNFRKHLIKAGDILHHFYGMRTKFCRKLGESRCSSNRNIIINHHVVFIATKNSGFPEWKGSFQEITKAIDLDEFAYADGFTNWKEMKLWWKVTHGTDCFPFIGQLIKW